MVSMALSAVLKVSQMVSGRMEVDIKRYAKVEKIPGGEIEDCDVLDGVMFNKDVTHSKMRRRIENPRVLLLDCPLEYKKGEVSKIKSAVLSTSNPNPDPHNIIKN